MDDISKRRDKKRAVIQINKYELLDKKNNIIENGLYDKNLENSNQNKPSNFGCIHLETPLFNIAFSKNIINVLNCVCFYCSSILFTKLCKLVSC